MKKFILPLVVLLGLFLFFANSKTVNAQMMMPMGGEINQNIINQTSQEETDGQAIYSNLTTGQVSANQLTNDDLERVGEYFMGRMAGNTQRHAFMNQMMSSMMGESAQEAIHVNMGRRYVNFYDQTGVLNNNSGSLMMGGCR